jgi:NDP-sugar pyrophosphorylase family protein
MKAMILAAGLGTRLKPLTDNTPKALVKINNKPMLQHVIERLGKFGFNDILINVHHFGDQIIHFIQSLELENTKITISDERGELLDTGGGLLKAQDFFKNSEAFLVHNVDIYSTIDLAEMYRSHIKKKLFVSLAVKHRTSSNYLLFDKDDLLCGWYSNKTGGKRIIKEQATYNEMAFSGIHIINPQIFDYVTEKGKFGIIPVYLKLAAQHKIGAYIHDKSDILDMGKPESLKQAEILIQKNEA